MAPTALNPNTNTREEFTLAAQQQTVPEQADQQWVALTKALMELQLKLLYHDAMAENRVQPFMTPAASKNSVYFMWDFVSRTIPNLYRVLPYMMEPKVTQTASAKRLWSQECCGRSLMAAELILDTRPGALDSMVEGLYPEQKGKHPAFGAEIMELAERVKQVVGQ